MGELDFGLRRRRHKHHQGHEAGRRAAAFFGPKIATAVARRAGKGAHWNVPRSGSLVQQLSQRANSTAAARCRGRWPVITGAGANTLIGFLNAMPFPARTKVSSHEHHPGPKLHRAWARRRLRARWGARGAQRQGGSAFPTELMRLPTPNLHRPASAVSRTKSSAALDLTRQRHGVLEHATIESPLPTPSRNDAASRTLFADEFHK